MCKSCLYWLYGDGYRTGCPSSSVLTTKAEEGTGPEHVRGEEAQKKMQNSGQTCTALGLLQHPPVVPWCLSKRQESAAEKCCRAVRDNDASCAEHPCPEHTGCGGAETRPLCALGGLRFWIINGNMVTPKCRFILRLALEALLSPFHMKSTSQKIRNLSWSGKGKNVVPSFLNAPAKRKRTLLEIYVQSEAQLMWWEIKLQTIFSSMCGRQ